MKRSLFHYNCPPELIAQEPAPKRDESRLLVFDQNQNIDDAKFSELPDVLNQIFSLKQRNAKLLLIGNNSKVYPARIKAFRKTGARCEIFVLELGVKENYSCMIKPKSKLKQNEILYLDQKAQRPIFEIVDFKNSKIKPLFSETMAQFLEKYGETPLPPYIKREHPAVKPRDDETLPRADEGLLRNEEVLSPCGFTGGAITHDKSRYQNIYANEANLGSAAAPTAGFHFTHDVLSQLTQFNIDIEYVTLHVGLGTFLPVKAENISEHFMHEENYCIKEETIKKIFYFLQNDWPIVFIGTTSLRSIESFFRKVCHLNRDTRPIERLHVQDNNIMESALTLADTWHSTNLFLYPEHENDRQAPIIGNGLLTNFHQPESSLLMLVASIIGFQNLKRVYSHALSQKYRFFSYGDSSLLIF